MKEYLLSMALFALCGCTIQYEDMAKNNPTRGDRYKYVVAQVGGQVTAKSSMGTSLAADDQKSFADFMQAAGVAVAGWTQASVSKAKEVTSRFEAGELTKQQAQAQLAAIRQAEIAAGVTEATTLNPNIIPK